jgi:methyl-accepting chemotaxis protein
MKTNTQSAASNAEQTASASEQMAAQAKALHEIVLDLELMLGARR